jgi:predicted dehydrogenase
MSDDFSRRRFIQGAAIASTSVLLSPALSSANSLFAGSPNQKIVVGVMGTNSQGKTIAKYFASLPHVEVGYICDVDQLVLEKTLAEIEQLTGKRPRGFSDIRRLLEQKDMDALAIAAPDHWHAPAAIMAMQAGKHVYIEKPCSHNPREGELLIAAAEKYKTKVQMGSQRRSYSNVKAMIAQLHAGDIGRVYFAKGWYAHNRPVLRKAVFTTPPAHLDFELWQGPVPRREFQNNIIHYNWHWYWHWGTGEALNNGTHELDVIRWGLGVDYPTQVMSVGGNFQFQDAWETPDTQTISYKFANNTGCTWEGRSRNQFPVEGTKRGVVFYGEKGSVVYDGGNGYKVFDQENNLILNVGERAIVDGKPEELSLAISSSHVRNFCEAIRGNESLTAAILEGHRSTLLPQLGNIAYRVGRVLTCDPANGRILNDQAAMKLWQRDYQPGWEIKL